MKIYIMTHRKCMLPEQEGYVPLQVGRANGENLGYLGDHTGDSISDLNSLFGELTGLYWIWKNDKDSDIIGVNHYRRFFAGPDGHLLKQETVEEILESYDLIAPVQTGAGFTHMEMYDKYHNIKDMEAVRKAIETCYPEYIDSFDTMMATKEGYYGNLCVMKRETYMAYCEWLFAVLFEASKEIDVSDYDVYHKRVYGFLSEPLLKVFVYHNQLKVKELEVIFASEKAETRELKLAIGQLLQMGQVEEANELFHNFVAYRPDVKLPASDIKRELPIIEMLLYIISMEGKYGLEGMYADSHVLSELIDNFRRIREVVQLQDTGREIPEELQKQTENLHITEIAKQVILQNLDF